MRMNMLGSTVAVALLLSAAPAVASPPAILNDPSRPSPVTVTDAFFTAIGWFGTTVDVVCLGFVQNSPKVAKGVKFNLAYLDAHGVVLGTEVAYAGGTFRPGVRAWQSAGHPVSDPFSNGNCHFTFHRGSGFTSSFMYAAVGVRDAVPVAAIVASAREIAYDDGTSFKNPDEPKTGDTLTFTVPPPDARVPFGEPQYSITTSVTEAPFRIADVATDGNRGHVCYTLKNGPKAGTLARIGLVKLGRDGNVIDVQATENRKGLEPDATWRDPICLDVNGRNVGDEFFTDAPSGRIAVGRVIAVPLREEFADGTAWDNPHPPHAGDSGAAFL